MSLLEESFEPPLPKVVPVEGVTPVSPIPTFTLRRGVAGEETELVVQTFDDRILVVVTQNGKVGCLTQASLPAIHSLQEPPRDADVAAGGALAALPPPPAAMELTPLLGSPPDGTAHDVYVSQIATLVWWSLQLARAPRRAVVVGLALRRVPEDEGERERERFAGVMDMVAAWEPK